MIKQHLGIRKSDVFNRRMFVIGIAKVVILAGIVSRLFSLQINENKKLNQRKIAIKTSLIIPAKKIAKYPKRS